MAKFWKLVDLSKVLGKAQQTDDPSLSMQQEKTYTKQEEQTEILKDNSLQENKQKDNSLQQEDIDKSALNQDSIIEKTEKTEKTDKDNKDNKDNKNNTDKKDQKNIDKNQEKQNNDSKKSEQADKDNKQNKDNKNSQQKEQQEKNKEESQDKNQDEKKNSNPSKNQQNDSKEDQKENKNASQGSQKSGGKGEQSSSSSSSSDQQDSLNQQSKQNGKNNSGQKEQGKTLKPEESKKDLFSKHNKEYEEILQLFNNQLMHNTNSEQKEQEQKDTKQQTNGKKQFSSEEEKTEKNKGQQDKEEHLQEDQEKAGGLFDEEKLCEKKELYGLKLDDEQKKTSLKDFKQKQNKNPQIYVEYKELKIQERMVELCIDKFLSKHFKVKKSTLNLQGENFKKTDGQLKWDTRKLVKHNLEKKYFDMFTDKYGFMNEQGKTNQIPLSFYFDLSGSMIKHSQIISQIAYELLKKGVKVLIGVNEKILYQIDEISNKTSKEELFRYITRDEEKQDLREKNKITAQKIVKKLDKYLIENKAEKCVVFSDFDAGQEITTLSKTAQVYWLCFRSDYFEARKKFGYDKVIEKAMGTKDIIKALEKFGKISYKNLIESQEQNLSEISYKNYSKTDLDREV